MIFKFKCYQESLISNTNTYGPKYVIYVFFNEKINLLAITLINPLLHSVV